MRTTATKSALLTIKFLTNTSWNTRKFVFEHHWYFGENAGWEIREMHMAVAAN